MKYVKLNRKLILDWNLIIMFLQQYDEFILKKQNLISSLYILA